jgi:hypothetical protein
MKRASLSALPPRPPAEPADLTDRLLAREGLPADEPVTPSAPVPPAEALRPAQPPARKRARPAKAAPAAAEPATPADPLQHALAQAAAAEQALRDAGRAAPARYEVALRYRLDALAHHVQQVAEFITARVGPTGS